MLGRGLGEAAMTALKRKQVGGAPSEGSGLARVYHA